MSIWMQTALAFVGLLLIMGYFQFRKHRDILDVIQEMARPAYLVPAGIGAVVYFVVKLVVDGLSKVL